MKEVRTYDNFVNEKKMTYAEKQQIVKDYYSKIEVLSDEIFDYVKDKGFDIFDDEEFKSDLQKVIEGNIDFHLPD